MMRVLGILGSPRAKGNTATLLRRVLEGAAAKGAATATINAYKLTVHGCQGCDACKRTGQCILKDDMQEVYEQIHAADAVIFASPNYLGGVSGNIKLVMDRLYRYCTFTEAGELGTTINSLKEAALLITQSAPEEYEDWLEAFTPLRNNLNLIFQGDVTKPVKFLTAIGMKNHQGVASDEQLLQKAYAFGAELLQAKV